jgi:hypothetical protein
VVFRIVVAVMKLDGGRALETTHCCVSNPSCVEFVTTAILEWCCVTMRVGGPERFDDVQVWSRGKVRCVH